MRKPGVGDFAQTPTLIGCWLLKSVLPTFEPRRVLRRAIRLLRHQRRSGIMVCPDSPVKRLVLRGVFLRLEAANPVANRSQEDALMGILHRNWQGHGPWPYNPCQLLAPPPGALGPRRPCRLTWHRSAKPATIARKKCVASRGAGRPTPGRPTSGRPVAEPGTRGPPGPACQRCLNCGGRFSRKAAMPSFWSCVANSEWKSRRSKSTPSLSGDS